MDLALSPEQQQLVQTFETIYLRSSSVDVVRKAEISGGFDGLVWAEALRAGAVDMAVDEAHGGGDATLLDLALVAEVHGRHIAPDPLVEAQVSARLLSRVATADADELLASILEGSYLTTLALTPTTAAGVDAWCPSRRWQTASLSTATGFLVSSRFPRSPAIYGNVGDLALADVAVGVDVTVLARSATAVGQAIDEWMVLTAAALVGVATRALEIAVAYTTDRRAFGAPIGSFQGVSHRLADCATAIDGARLLVQEAAWAASEDPDRAPELAAMAFAFAAETARTTTQWSLHFHGGYGFMVEYDIQMYWRRAVAMPALLAEPARYTAGRPNADPTDRSEEAPHNGLQP